MNNVFIVRINDGVEPVAFTEQDAATKYVMEDLIPRKEREIRNCGYPEIGFICNSHPGSLPRWSHSNPFIYIRIEKLEIRTKMLGFITPTLRYAQVTLLTIPDDSELAALVPTVSDTIAGLPATTDANYSYAVAHAEQPVMDTIRAAGYISVEQGEGAMYFTGNADVIMPAWDKINEVAAGSNIVVQRIIPSS